MKNLEVKRSNSGEVCKKPTRHNPFMNVAIPEISEFPNRPPACNPLEEGVKENVEDHFDHNLYRDVDDIYGKKTMSRQFYTMPSTTIPNDMTAFAHWLYDTGPTCKEGNGLACSRGMYERLT
jgi:hypothetical protein